VQGLLERGAMAEVQRELHSLKGLSATLGIAALSQTAAQVEALAKQQDPGHHAALTEGLEAIRRDIATQAPVLQTLIERLRSSNSSIGSSVGSTVSAEVRKAMVQALANLLALLHKSDMGAMELHADLPRVDDGSMDEALEPLDAAMADMDFERAAGHCQTLMDQWKTGTST
jgi:HPt (histidine-containing phosphotransfer) domain-containing protein